MPTDLFVAYQPFINLATGRVQGYEAFARRSTAASPADSAAFVRQAAHTDLICDLDTWVLHTALTQLSRWHAAIGSQDLILAINLSSRHVAQPRLISDVLTGLQVSGTQADRVLVDLSEVDVLADPAAGSTVRTLRQLGVAVCLDASQLLDADVATALAGRTIDIVKLNPGLLDTTLTAPETVTRFVRDVHAQGLPIVAGGIETGDQLDTARSLGCEWAQGFYLGLPRPAEDITTPDVARSAG